ncbi:flagellar assembly protein FliW [bacterium]|nr:flagellar assembly protein FliW [bacterium]
MTERFGMIEIDPSEIFEFPLGIIGFPEYHRFGLHHDEKLSPFMWLQSLEEPRLCFFIVEPFLIFSNYEIEVKLDDILERDLGDMRDLLVLTICTIAADFRDSTANLVAPLIITKERLIGYQVVLEDDRYATRHRLFDPVGEPDAHLEANESRDTVSRISQT